MKGGREEEQDGNRGTREDEEHRTRERQNDEELDGKTVKRNNRKMNNCTYSNSNSNSSSNIDARGRAESKKVGLVVRLAIFEQI